MIASVFLQDLTVARLKELVKDKIGIPPEQQVLLYGGRQLEEGNLPSSIGMQATIFLVGRLLGGSRMERVDPTLPRSIKACAVMLVEDECMKMPCGHFMSPDAVMHCAQSAIGNKENSVHCPICKDEWPIDVLRRYGGTSEEEQQELEEGLSQNYCDTKLGIVQCPRCSSYCMRADPRKVSVECIACSKQHGKSHRFCFLCLQSWKNGQDEYTCGNLGCDDTVWRERILQNCPETEMAYSKSNSPSIRQCPNPKCQFLIEHAKGCKHMICESCKIEFCFVCLEQKVGGTWPASCGSYSTKCQPAPRQA